MKKILFVTLFVVSFFGLSAQTTLDTAISFTVKDIAGITHRLDEYLNNNKIVVIDFFTVTCGPCATYTPDFNKSYIHFGCNSSNVVFLGINWGADNAQVSQFGSTYGVQYPEISGTEGNGNHVVMDYNILSYPTVIIIRPDYSIAENYIYPPSTEAIDSLITLHGGIKSACYTYLNESDKQQNQLHIFPNPTKDIINCSMQMKQPGCTVQLYSFSGSAAGAIYSFDEQQTIQIPIESLSRGSYFVLLRNKNGTIIDKEILIAN